MYLLLAHVGWFAVLARVCCCRCDCSVVLVVCLCCHSAVHEWPSVLVWLVSPRCSLRCLVIVCKLRRTAGSDCPCACVFLSVWMQQHPGSKQGRRQGCPHAVLSERVRACNGAVAALARPCSSACMDARHWDWNGTRQAMCVGALHWRCSVLCNSGGATAMDGCVVVHRLSFTTVLHPVWCEGVVWCAGCMLGILAGHPCAALLQAYPRLLSSCSR